MKQTVIMSNASSVEAYGMIGKIIIFTSFIILSVVYLMYHYIPWPVLDLPTPIDRLVFTLQWHTVSLGVLYNAMEVNMYLSI